MTNLLNRQAFERAVFSYFMQGGKCGAYCLMDVDDLNGSMTQEAMLMGISL